MAKRTKKQSIYSTAFLLLCEMKLDSLIVQLKILQEHLGVHVRVFNSCNKNVEFLVHSIKFFLYIDLEFSLISLNKCGIIIPI